MLGLTSRASAPRGFPTWLGGRREQVGSIGLEFSRELLHAVQMERGSRGVRIRAAVSVPFGCTREALLADPRRVKRLVRETLRSKPFSGRKIVTCAPPADVKISMASYRLEADDDEEVVIAGLASERIEGRAEDWVIDFIPVRTPDGELERSALITCIERVKVLDMIGMLGRAGLEVTALEIGPVALGRLVTTMNGLAEHSTVLVVNFGQDKTYMTVFSGRRLALERDVGFGERDIVQLLAENLELDPTEAAAMLSRFGVRANPVASDLAGGEVGRAIEEIAKHRFVELAGEIENVAIYSASQLRGAAIDHIYLLGSVARWRGSDALLAGLLSLPVSILNPFDAFAANTDAAVLGDLDPIAGIAVATGCAPRGLTDA